MKKLSIYLILFGLGFGLEAAYLRNVPQTIVQPDGTTVNCFAEGDEFHRWLYDSEGYTIILNTETGFFVYADVVDDELVPTEFVVGQNQFPKNIQPNKNISAKAWQQKRNAMNINYPVRTKNTGTLNNIVIFLRFSDDTEFNTAINVYEQMFNDVDENANSMKHYYKEVSYEKLSVNSTFYPEPQNGIVCSYQDNYPRNYYRVFSPSNPQGYSEAQKQTRLQTLLRNAVLAVRDQIPTDLDVDFDNDGNVDNICFIVKGDVEAWADLLWPQMNNFDNSFYVSINGKRCYTYNFQMENYTLNNVGVLCHEMFHSLGAPDLYHYFSYGNFPVGEWDLMELTTEPPQSMGAYMKYKYGKWVDEIPVISESGFYEVNRLQTGENDICFRINVPETTQEYILVENRFKSGVFEGQVPGSGLLIYRILPHLNGNANPMSPDEVYIYRPGGNYANNWNQSAFSYQNGRTNFHRNITDPACVLSDNRFGSVGIHHITQIENNKIRFYAALGNAPFLFVKDETTYISSAANNSNGVDVYTNLSSWEVSTNAQWLSVTKNETDNQIIFTTLSANNTTNNRTAFVNISGGEFEQIIRVIQYAGQTSLTVTPRTQTVEGVKDASADYSVSTNYPAWTATTTANWVDLSIDLDNNILTATAKTDNPQSTERQAIIRVTSGNTSVNVYFVQSVKTVNIVELNPELNSGTNYELKVFPNPTRGELTISDFPMSDVRLSDNRISHIEIYDITGRNVFSTKARKRESTNENGEVVLDISVLPAGIYFLRVGSEMIKIVKH